MQKYLYGIYCLIYIFGLLSRLRVDINFLAHFYRRGVMNALKLNRKLVLFLTAITLFGVIVLLTSCPAAIGPDKPKNPVIGWTNPPTVYRAATYTENRVDAQYMTKDGIQVFFKENVDNGEGTEGVDYKLTTVPGTVLTYDYDWVQGELNTPATTEDPATYWFYKTKDGVKISEGEEGYEPPEVRPVGDKLPHPLDALEKISEITSSRKDEVLQILGVVEDGYEWKYRKDIKDIYNRGEIPSKTKFSSIYELMENDWYNATHYELLDGFNFVEYYSETNAYMVDTNYYINIIAQTSLDPALINSNKLAGNGEAIIGYNLELFHGLTGGFSYPIFNVALVIVYGNTEYLLDLRLINIPYKNSPFSASLLELISAELGVSSATSLINMLLTDKNLEVYAVMENPYVQENVIYGMNEYKLWRHVIKLIGDGSISN
jgi:hypothetical protein